MKEQEGCLPGKSGTIILVTPGIAGMAPAVPGEGKMEFHAIIAL